MALQFTNNLITHNQRKRIFALARSVNIMNEQLHEYLPAWVSHDSLKDMSFIKAQKVISILNKLQLSDKLTKKQYGKIKSIIIKYNWNESRLNGFIRHTIGKNSISELSSYEATQVITGLQKYLCKNEVK